MAKPSFPKLRAAFDKQSLLYLEEVEPDIADALREEVANGADPDSIRRFVVATVGQGRTAIVDRCVGAARYLESQQVKA